MTKNKLLASPQERYYLNMRELSFLILKSNLKCTNQMFFFSFQQPMQAQKIALFI